MTRTGLAILLVIALAAIGFAMVARVTGPGSETGEAPSAGTPEIHAVQSKPLIVPVEGVTSAALVDSWADPRGGSTRVHHALDIIAPQGAPVLAAADGRIEKLFTSALGGLTVYERSRDGGTVYYYAHLERYAPTLIEGQAVRAGQVIASVGATGDADPATPHLHFEVHRMAPGEGWWQGREVDPYPLLEPPA